MPDQSATKLARKPRKMARDPQSPAVLHTANTHDSTENGPIAPAGRVTKGMQLLAMLRRPQGATVEDIVAFTGWLPHTTRAALTGLRKKGHSVTSDKPDGEARVYRVAPQIVAGSVE